MKNKKGRLKNRKERVLLTKKFFLPFLLGLSVLLAAGCNQNAADEQEDRFTEGTAEFSQNLNDRDVNLQTISDKRTNFRKQRASQTGGHALTVPTDGIQHVGNGYLTIEHNSYQTTTPSSQFPHSKYVKKGQYAFFKEFGSKGKERQRRFEQKDVRQPETNTGEPSGNIGKQPAGTSAITEIERKVVELTNEQRRKHGLKELTLDETLSRVAKAKADDMNNNHYFSHTSPTYGSPFDMMRDFGVSYKSAGENIAMGQTTAEQVVDAWMNSEGHRKNILNANYTHIGVGFSKGGNYWSQMFIQK